MRQESNNVGGAASRLMMCARGLTTLVVLRQG